MLENESKFDWTEPKQEAAQLLAEDELTDAEIADKIGIVPQTLYRWKKQPEFSGRVDELAKEFGNACLKHAIAKRARRVRALQARWDKLQQVIEDRACQADMQTVPGGPTGLIVKQVKAIGKGDDFEKIEEYAVDTGLLKEIRDHEKQAAQELGQWVEKGELSGANGAPFKVYVGVDIDKV